MLAKPAFRMGRRTLGREMMDDAPRDAALASVRDLVRINRWFGGHRALRSVFHRLVTKGEKFTVLDIGAASGDSGRVLAAEFPGAEVTSLDYRMDHLEGAPWPKLVGDARALPFLDSSFDFVMCSLFLHHFADGEIVDLLCGMRRVARSGVVVIDLERHWLPFYFLAWTRPLFGWRDITVYDGRLSVAAGFRRAELRDLGLRTGAAEARVRGFFPWFRLAMVLAGAGSDPVHGTGGAKQNAGR